jgi:hypothetical protein
MSKTSKLAGTCLVIALALTAVLWQASPAAANGRDRERGRAAQLVQRVQQQEQDDATGDDANGDDNGNVGGMNYGDDDTGEVEVSGVLKSRPAEPEVQGTWVVSTSTGDVTFTVDAGTQFELEDGALVAGGCVEVEAKSAAPGVATGIESESASECGAAASASGDD